MKNRRSVHYLNLYHNIYQNKSGKKVVIEFVERKDEVDGFYLLMIAGVPIHGNKYIGEHRYLVPEDSLYLLEQEKIRYKKIKIK